MPEALTSEEARRYTAIIDEILGSSDLNLISAKAIRKGLQEKVEDDINAKKKPVTDLIMQRFDLFNSTPTNVVPTTETTPPPATHTNGASASPAVKRETNGTSKKRSSPTTDDNESEDDALSSVADTPPPAKRTKIEKAGKETDEEYARRLQAELNRVQGRSTRGGGATTKRKPAPKQRKKKSKATVGSDEDSDVEGGEKKGVKRTGGFHKPMALSAQLSALVNETQLSRPQTVKKIWEYIKSNELQDPSDKRQIICDDAMRNVFKTDKVHMFTMNKVINTHLYPVEETVS